MFNGRRQPSCDGTSRMTRECQVRICERLGVKFPGPTRHSRPLDMSLGIAARPLRPLKRTNKQTSRHVRFVPDEPHHQAGGVLIDVWGRYFPSPSQEAQQAQQNARAPGS
jgi:hypothetical protein